MREILFRGKRLDNGEWVEGFYYSMAETTYCFEEDYKKYPVPIHHYIMVERMTDWGLPNRMCQAEVNPETVCQYTGLTDKNGRKIFEGDILKRVLLPTKRIENYFRIAFVPVKSCFSAIDLDGSNVTFISDYINNSYEIEVIGNIFDNPELSKGD